MDERDHIRRVRVPRPSHMFAKVAQYMGIGSAVFGFWWLLQFIFGWPMSITIQPFTAALVLGVGAVLVLTVGLVCELVIRSRYTLTGHHPWKIARTEGVEVGSGEG